jgi:hypothetical protein
MDDGVQELTTPLSRSAVEYVRNWNSPPFFQHVPPLPPCTPGDGFAYMTSFAIDVNVKLPNFWEVILGKKRRVSAKVSGRVVKVGSKEDSKPTNVDDFHVDPRRPPTSPGDGYLYLVEQDGTMSMLPVALV